MVDMFPHLIRTPIPFQVGRTDMESRVAKTVKRREWTKQDVRELKGFARQKTPAPKIARSLKRTVGAIRQKAFTMGVSLDSRA
jgi:hypothetical protein